MFSRRIWFAAIFYSVVMISLGFWVSLATGEWIAILCAFGLVVLPSGGLAFGLRASRHKAPHA